MDMDIIEITITYGFDFGIARSWKSETIARRPAELAAALGKR